MPWTLTAAVDCGDLDTGTYGEVKIVRFTHDPVQKRMTVRLAYGNTVDSVWEGGMLPNGKSYSVPIVDTDYDDVVADSVPDVQTEDPSDSNYSQVGAVWVEKTYYATKRALYEWLNANEDIAAGSVT